MLAHTLPYAEETFTAALMRAEALRTHSEHLRRDAQCTREISRRAREEACALRRKLELQPGGSVFQEPDLRLRVCLPLPEDLSSLRIARRACEGFPRQAGVAESLLPAVTADLAIVVGELCANVLCHARSPIGMFWLVLDSYPGRMVVTVKDCGSGFDPYAIPEPGYPRSDALHRERIGGFGLPLVETLTTRLEYRRTVPYGMLVQATIPLPC